MALYHVLSVFRNIQWSNMAARTGDPDQWLEAHQNVPFHAHNPRGHTIGIIGMGNIGSRIATKMYKAFDANIIYNDLARRSVEQEADSDATFYPGLDDMLAASDCVILAIPGTGGKGFLTAIHFAKMKAGSRLVNIARGPLVDEEALADALESGHLAAAGLDVHANEPHVNARLAEMRNVTLTSHNAGSAVQTNIEFEALAMQNIEAVLTGKAPLTAVNSIT